MEHVIYKLATRYPQVYLPIEEGISKSEEYKNTCLKGMKSTRQLDFTFNENDTLETVKTIAGDVEVLLMYDRKDFEHMYRALGFKGEPADVPSSTGAMALFGLNNWEKVRAGLENYKDCFILLSSGNYSNVDIKQIQEVTSSEINLSKDEWTNKSITIRKYHELTHFVMRKLYPDNIDAIRDELIADIVGLLCAFEKLDVRVLKLFLGLENDEYREGGRLQNYEGGNKENIPNVLKLIDKLIDSFKECEGLDIELIWKHIEKVI